MNALIGLLVGLLFYRLALSSTVVFYHWKQKMLNYIILPLFLSGMYTIIIKLLNIQMEWNKHILLTFFIGLIIQHQVVKKREEYFRKNIIVKKEHTI